MIRGLYTSAAGMVVNATRQQIVSNNLTNANTTGYKEDFAIRTSMPEMKIIDPRTTNASTPIPLRTFLGTAGTGVAITGIETSLEQGVFKQTNNLLDFAIAGNGFFEVQAPDGQIYQTRNGSFIRDVNGQLVTTEGYLVQGQTGAIVLPEGIITVASDGTISVEGQVVDQLRIVNFPEGTQLEKVSFSLFTSNGVAANIDTFSSVYQGYIEASNVDTGRSMVEMISAMRAYEAQSRVLRMLDQTLGQAANELGKV